jgi:heme exporter protein A
MRFFGENLTCVRGERIVFAGLNFSLSSGDALTLVGRNGSGKTSLLRVMAGLTRSTAGTIAWDDGAVSEDPGRHHGRLHYVSHQDAVKPVLSVQENLMLWTRLRRGTEDGLAAGLDRFGLTALADIPGRYLSAGQRRRLSLARISATPAALWLLDEPTVALDRESVAALSEAIADHRAGGGMVVVATNVDLDLTNSMTIDLRKFAAPQEVSTADFGWTT